LIFIDSTLNLSVPAKPGESVKPSERFKNAMRQILSVPKSELLKREALHKQERAKSGKPKKH